MRVGIGGAAALFGLNPSTLRWWERQGVLPTPDRSGGRRVYGRDDLRRIGLAYLCCVIGRMPLDRAGVVTSGSTGLDEWQNVIRENIVRLDREVERLDSARSYLKHLLRCEADDIVADCRMLEIELVRRTPRGGSPDPDLISAARTMGDLHVPRPTREPGDETSRNNDACDENDGQRAVCPTCADPLVQPTHGRHRRYCSHRCRQQAYRARRADRSNS
ncbi:helix-turn-helix domain-containing protein [Nocardia sp. FBN12]|uniref:helix-turn-helix domain-containing protein n=1 Tax=Nocardia sp. FBN12 TaxID=3419766 RepID=UPI003D085C0F